MQLTQCVLQFYLAEQTYCVEAGKVKKKAYLFVFLLICTIFAVWRRQVCHKDILRKAFGLAPTDESRHFILLIREKGANGSSFGCIVY